jgi:hypothetical protein
VETGFWTNGFGNGSTTCDWCGSLARTNAANVWPSSKGSGPQVATALGAGNAQQFKSGRELRQHSSGARTVLLGIGKRDPYLRTLLIHGHARRCALWKAEKILVASRSACF